MISLKLNGTALALNKNTTILFKKKNGLFFNDVIPSSYSLPFTLPVKGNEAALNYQHLTEIQESIIRIQNVSLLFYGNLEAIGTLELKKSDDATFVCSFYTTPFVDVKIATLFPGVVLGSEPGSDAAAVNNRSWPDARYCWPSYINDDEYFNATYIHKYVNRHDATGFTVTVGGLLVPLGVALYLGYVIKTVVNGIGFTAKGDLFDDAELMQLIVWNNYVFRWNGGNWEAREYLLVPDITVNDFFIAIKKWLGVHITIDYKTNEIWFDTLRTFRDKAKRVSIDHTRDRDIPITFADKNGMNISLQFTDSYNSGAVKSLENVTITGTINLSSDLVGSAAAPGEYWRCRGDHAIYFINENGDHEFYSYDYEAVDTGDGDEVIDVPVGPLTEFLDYPDIQEQLLPRINQPISDEVVRNPFDLHLLFFRGYAETAKSPDTYPLATAHNLKLIQANPNYEVVGQYSLYPNGQYGTYENFYKQHDTWLSGAKKITTKLYWSLSDWLAFDDRKLLLMEGQAYVWEEMDISASLDGIEYVKVKMVKA